jgi:hypothetical protein
MLDAPKLTAPIVLFLAAALCVLVAKFQDRWADSLRISLVVLGCVLGLFGVVTLFNWIAYMMAVRLHEINQARQADPVFYIIERRLQLVQNVANLPPEYIKALSSMVFPIYEFIGGTTGPIPALRVENGNVPYWFVQKFWELSTMTHLVPVRTWSAETKERQWAEDLTRYLISFGLANPAAGNQPASWVNKEAANTWLFGQDHKEIL